MNSSLSTLAGYEVASLLQSFIYTYHSPFNQFQRFLSLRVIPSYSDRKEKGNSKHPGLPYPLSSTIRTPFSISEPYLHFQYQLPSSSDNPYRKVLTHQNDCRTNSLGHHPHILPASTYTHKKLPSDKTPKSLHV